MGSPLQALNDTIGLVRQWWTAPYRATGGVQFPARDWAHAFGPVRTPPVYLAAVGPQAIRLAAERFDGLLMTEFASEHFMKRLVHDLAAPLKSRGTTLEHFPIFMRTAIEVTDDPEPALERRKYSDRVDQRAAGHGAADGGAWI